MGAPKYVDRMGYKKWLVAAGSASWVALGATSAVGQVMNNGPMVWPDATTADCPFPRSTRIKAEVKLTGRSAVVPGSGADTWYPSWASDGTLYSTFADGTVNGF